MKIRMESHFCSEAADIPASLLGTPCMLPVHITIGKSRRLIFQHALALHTWVRTLPWKDFNYDALRF